MARGRLSGGIHGNNPWRGTSAPPAGGGPGGGTGGPGQADVLRVQFPPIYLPPAGAQNFFAAGNQAFGPGPVAFAAFTGAQASVKLPQGMPGVIRSYTLLVNGLLLTSAIQFSIRANNSPLAGVGNVLMPQGGVAVFIDSPDSPGVFIKVPAGALIQVFAQVTDAVAYSLSFSLRGWMYNKTVEDQWRGII